MRRDRGVGLGMRLAVGAGALRVDDRAGHVHDHPAVASVTSQGRSASASPGRIAVPSRTSMMSRTLPSLFGPGRPGSVRQEAAAARIAAIWSRVSA